ncbi:hypothetical protein E2C01_061517 [Portunus trituberculatus]|uniref:Uncharacterized protein n=1 Tax=Portunus trituberculatus TaxID=210409 RepID=A0A5B7H8C4_PORTR|nr:hypothetical protein [Portunus trituberculatus]
MKGRGKGEQQLGGLYLAQGKHIAEDGDELVNVAEGIVERCGGDAHHIGLSDVTLWTENRVRTRENEPARTVLLYTVSVDHILKHCHAAFKRFYIVEAIFKSFKDVFLVPLRDQQDFHITEGQRNN